MNYTDIHCHMLYGTDDGPATREDMLAMLDAAYASGTRSLCLTPHFNPLLFGDNHERAERAFRELSEYAAERYPDMKLALGNELYYSYGSVGSLADGVCRTMNGTRQVLVDFDFGASMTEMQHGLSELLSGGYIPIYAHVERYDAVKPPFRELEQLKRMGVIIQINSTSLCGGWGVKLRHKTLKLLRRGIPDIVASDAHSLGVRHPRLDECEQLLLDRYGEAYTHALMSENPARAAGIN